MKKYKFIHDLAVSIFLFFFLILSTTMFSLMLYWGVLHPQENTNTGLILLFDILIFGTGTIVLFYLLFFHTLVIVVINHDGIYLKRFFCKKIIYNWNEIEKICIEKVTQIGAGGSLDGGSFSFLSKILAFLLFF